MVFEKTIRQIKQKFQKKNYATIEDFKLAEEERKVLALHQKAMDKERKEREKEIAAGNKRKMKIIKRAGKKPPMGSPFATKSPIFSDSFGDMGGSSEVMPVFGEQKEKKKKGNGGLFDF